MRPADVATHERAPSALSTAAAETERASPDTSCRRDTRALTTEAPMEPDPPSTRTFIS